MIGTDKARKPAKRGAVLIILCLASIPTLFPTQNQLPDRGTVTFVYDGDTVRIRFADGVSRKVRLIGIDTPELSDRREDILLRAQIARRFALHHLRNREVRLSYDWPLYDRYGRVLAYLWTDAAVLFNRLILEKGIAFVMRSYPFRLMEDFIRAESEARRSGEGFWSEEDPEPVSAAEAAASVGRLGSVRFRCARVLRQRGFVFLETEDRDLAALIPEGKVSSRFDAASFKGRTLVVSGFIEDYGGQTQVMLFFPRQVRIEGSEFQKPGPSMPVT